MYVSKSRMCIGRVVVNRALENVYSRSQGMPLSLLRYVDIIVFCADVIDTYAILSSTGSKILAKNGLSP